MHAIVKALDVDANQPVEISLTRALYRSDMRNSGVVHKDMDALAREDFVEDSFNPRLIRHITNVNGSRAAALHDELPRPIRG